jgi:hypothetical protein
MDVSLEHLWCLDAERFHLFPDAEKMRYELVTRGAATKAVVTSCIR